LGDATPPATKGNTAGGLDLGNLKTVADEQKEMIAMLLRQQTDSESAINIKVAELESLQRFHRESEVCVRLMEDELGTANTKIETLLAQVADVGDMQALIRRFTQESSEMLTIIDGMEKEIDSLQAKLKK
jgi:chromosome segregation ATPase